VLFSNKNNTNIKAFFFPKQIVVRLDLKPKKNIKKQNLKQGEREKKGKLRAKSLGTFQYHKSILPPPFISFLCAFLQLHEK
jgi:hypothetical protein